MKEFVRFQIICIILTVALITLSFSGCRNPPEPPALFAIRHNDKWGYINRKGEVVIQPQFAWTSWVFSEDLAEACIGTGGGFGFNNKDKCGYIDPLGRFVINPEYKNTSRFSEGLAAVLVNDKWGYVDKTGKMIIVPQFQEAMPFSDELAVVKIGEKYGFIDKTGKVVINPQFETAAPLFDGLAAIVLGKKAGYVDKTGRMVINPQFDLDDKSSSAEPFANSLAAVKVNGKYGYIDKTGKIVIAPQFDLALPFSEEGIALVVDNKKIGFINKNGAYQITPNFDGEQYNQVIPWWYAFLAATPEVGRVSFSEGLAPVKMSGGKMGYVDKSGRVVIYPQFESANPFYKGLALVDFFGEMGWIDKDGRYVWREVKEAKPTPTASPTPTQSSDSDMKSNMSMSNSSMSNSFMSNGYMNSNSSSTMSNGYMNSNSSSTPNKAQLQRVVNSYLAGVEIVTGGEELKAARLTAYGDIDGDGDEDAVVQFVIEGAGGGNNTGTSLAVFINNNGKFHGVTDEAVGGNHWRDFQLNSVQQGEIAGTVTVCIKDSYPCEAEVERKRDITILWQNSRLNVPE